MKGDDTFAVGLIGEKGIGLGVAQRDLKVFSAVDNTGQRDGYIAMDMSLGSTAWLSLQAVSRYSMQNR